MQKYTAESLNFLVEGRLLAENFTTTIIIATVIKFKKFQTFKL
jgi:hypothetical protein